MHKFNCPTKHAKITLAVWFKTTAVAYKPGYGPDGFGRGKIGPPTPKLNAESDGDDYDRRRDDPASAVITLEYSKSSFSIESCTAFLHKLREGLGCFNDFTVVVDGGAGWKTMRQPGVDDVGGDGGDPSDELLCDVVSDQSHINAIIKPMEFSLEFDPAEIVFDLTAVTSAPPRSPARLSFPDGAEFVATTVADLRVRIRQQLRSKSIVTRIEVPALSAANGSGKPCVCARARVRVSE
jgi:hypothetical protein